jgi:hypothetical protein
MPNKTITCRVKLMSKFTAKDLKKLRARSAAEQEAEQETHRSHKVLIEYVGHAAEVTKGWSDHAALEWTEEYLVRNGITVPTKLSMFLKEASGLWLGIPEPRRKGERMDTTPTPWVWEGVVMAGAMNLLVAPPKIGKSALMVGMIAAWWRGEAEYLGRQLHGSCPPVFVVGTDQPENDWFTLFKREGLIREDGTMGGPVEALWHAGAPLHLNEQGIGMLTQLAQANPGAMFLVDSYHACVSPLGIDEATSAFDGPARRLQEALAPHQATLVAIHHANKSVSGGNATNASRGSNSLPAAASLTILMNWLKQPVDGQTQSDFRVVVKTQGRAKGSTLLVELEDNGWVCHGDGQGVLHAESLSAAQLELSGRQADAFDYIADRWELGGFQVSGVELASHLNLQGNKANRCLQQLLAKGLIKKVGQSEPAAQGGRPSGLFTPATPLPPEGEAKGEKGKNPSRTYELKGISPSSSSAYAYGGGGLSTPPVEPTAPTGDALTAAEGLITAHPKRGMAVEKLGSDGCWQNGWVIQDASNPHKVEIVRLGNSLLKFIAQRWLIDIRPCAGSPWPAGDLGHEAAQAEEHRAPAVWPGSAEAESMQEDWI